MSLLQIKGQAKSVETLATIKDKINNKNSAKRKREQDDEIEEEKSPNKKIKTYSPKNNKQTPSKEVNDVVKNTPTTNRKNSETISVDTEMSLDQDEISEEPPGQENNEELSESSKSEEVQQQQRQRKNKMKEKEKDKRQEKETGYKKTKRQNIEILRTLIEEEEEEEEREDESNQRNIIVHEGGEQQTDNVEDYSAQGQVHDNNLESGGRVEQREIPKASKVENIEENAASIKEISPTSDDSEKQLHHHKSKHKKKTKYTIQI